MNDPAYYIGWLMGTLTMIFVTIMIWHVGESECQQENNVADCVLASEVFVPAPEEGK